MAEREEHFLRDPALYMGLFSGALVAGAFWLSSLNMVGGIVISATIYTVVAGVLVLLFTEKIRLDERRRGDALRFEMMRSAMHANIEKERDANRT